MPSDELVTEITQLVQQRLEQFEADDWSFEVIADLQRRPDGGLSIEFQHPLSSSRSFGYGLGPSHLESALELIDAWMSRCNEFSTIAAATGKIRSKSVPLLQRLRSAAKSKDVSRAMQSVGWALHTHDVLTREEAEWFEMAVESDDEE